MSSPSSCPDDNSTEAILCLLRLITDNTQPSWSWDPLNFGVTLAIGILALIIAAITVGQGLLAAGPGRLKASNLAIGPFSINSRSRFDRTELALRTTARVPLITWDVIYHRIVRQKFRPNFDLPAGRLHQRNADDKEAGAQAIDEYNDGSRTWSTTTIKQRHQYDSTATWLTLLTTLGLDDPQFFPLIQRVTDYLPADVQAAPAAAELRCLAILAVIADTGATIEPAANRFIRVSADSSQLGFRDHPIMGAVAAYEAYEATAMLKVGDSPPLEFGTHLQNMKFEDLDRCLQLASGRLSYADGRIPPSLDGVVDERTFMLLVGDLRKRSTCTHEICVNAVDDWTNGMAGVRENRQPWHYISAMKTLYMATSLLAADRANVCRGFPKKTMKLTEGLEAIVKLSEYWSTEWTKPKMMQFAKIVCLTFWNQGNVKYREALSASWVVDFTDMRSTVPNPFSPSMARVQKQYFKQDKTLFFLTKIRSFLTKQFEPADLPTEGYEEHKLSSVALAHLLACVDEWLLRKGGAAASCSMLKLLYKLGFQSGLLTIVRKEDQETSFFPQMLGAQTEAECVANGVLEKPSVDGEIQLQIDAHCLDACDMSTMIILRGILMAILLDDGADTSMLYQSDFRNSIVRVL